ncbi:ketoacyl-ACP synthase III family protein [Nocardiopsis sp. FIRDI 009]|uniref:ketoacyl-ACP synthase III family protein n=1 Tax=Nocardiopsis sp. FIRDI 009 TaxID=714197 RepID=UPI000E25C1FA|nr:ketoacyl-ACP synthase III family protein [Nocardiopsis sp. FIRDI 009]
MRRENLFIAGLGSYLPKTQTADEARRLGLYSAEQQDLTQQLSVTVSGPDESAPDMAVEAARQALARARVAPPQVNAVFHAAVLHSGIDVWNAASYIQGRIATRDCAVAEIRSGSNGGLSAVEVAADHLAARGASYAVVTAGDVFPSPGFDKWGSDRVHYADGCAAAVLSGTDGFARVASLVTTTDPELEGMHRGDQPFGPFRHGERDPIDLVRRQREFTEHTMDRDEVWRRMDRGLTTAVRRSLEEADTTLDQISRIVVPHFGAHLTRKQMLRPLGLTDLDRTTWDFSRRVGHLGPGDQIAGLDHLAENGALAPGDRVLLLGAGAGFTWSSAVLNILSTPAWSF